MVKKDKLLDKAFNNPKGFSFKEFETLLRHHGWSLDRQTGSHKIYCSSDGIRLPIQNRQGKAKGYQVKQFINYMKKVQDEKK